MSSWWHLVAILGSLALVSCEPGNNDVDGSDTTPTGDTVGGEDIGDPDAGDSGEDPEVALQLQLEAEYGSLTETPEAPDFGDTAVLELEATEADELVDDDFASGQVDDTELEKQRVVVINWGGEDTVAQDWSGQIVATNVAIKTLRKLNFEAGEDRLRVRTRLKEIPFVSETTGDYDGIQIKVYTHDIFETDPAVPPSLTVETPAGNYVIDLSEGSGAGEQELGSGNMINHFLMTPDLGECATGMFFTYWAQGLTHLEMGRVIAWDGTLIGKLRGVWGVRANGASVFYWKLIDEEGALLGIVAGRWTSRFYAGRYLGPGKVVEGGLLGTWWHGIGTGGFSAGLWLTGCDALSIEGQVDADDEANGIVDAELTFGL